MLVLSRYPDEAILIGETIRIDILEVDGGRVRLGVSAPEDVPILRDELQAEDAADRQPEAIASQ